MTTIVWFRQDLRLSDHPAFTAALDNVAERDPRIIPVYILDEVSPQLGGAAQWWLHHSLAALARDLAARGSRLVLRRGDPETEITKLQQETGATAVYWNRRFEPVAIRHDQAIKTQLKASGINAQSFPGNHLHDPWRVLNRQGKPFRVFTPYWKALITAGIDVPPLSSLPNALPPVPPNIASMPLEMLGLLPDILWDRAFPEHWQPGEHGAWESLAAFLPKIESYAEGRNALDGQGVSRLSPHLRFGEITPRQISAALFARYPHPLEVPGVEHFLRELGWREFGAYLLYHDPQSGTEPLNPRFAAFPWRDAPNDLSAWQRGETGIPVVDAAMRSLWATGWMHNRARMIVASFLTKNLLIDWRCGADWFMDTLVDADLASNTAGWQWTAGTGADAAPFFRIFNPILQAEKFDPHGDFIRQWLPELTLADNKTLFAPWQATDSALSKAGIRLGETYPEPIVDLAASRRRALDTFAQIKAGAVHEPPQ
jgi:deoxyribodipyrimidine photo-lyase